MRRGISPFATLERIREIVSWVASGEREEAKHAPYCLGGACPCDVAYHTLSDDELTEAKNELVELVSAFDRHIVQGGELPAQWKKD